MQRLYENTIEVKDSVDSEKWNETLKKYGFSIFNTIEWSKFISDFPRYLVATNSKNEIVGGMTFHKDSILGLKSFVAEAIPFGESDEVKQQLLDSFKKLGGIKIIDTTFKDGRINGFHVTEKATVVIDLTKPLDELWKDIDKKKRYDIRKADGVVVTSDFIHTNTFYKIYSSASKLWQTKPFPQDFFKRVELFLYPKYVKMFCTYSDKKIASCAIVLMSGDTLVFYINATNPLSNNQYANSLLVWEIIKYGKEHDFKYLDLFGYDLFAKKGEPTYGINSFKTSFGGKIIKFDKYSTSIVFILARKLYNKVRFIKKLYWRLK